jgi:hypothetical protein
METEAVNEKTSPNKQARIFVSDSAQASRTLDLGAPDAPTSRARTRLEVEERPRPEINSASLAHLVRCAAPHGGAH